MQNGRGYPSKNYRPYARDGGNSLALVDDTRVPNDDDDAFGDNRISVKLNDVYRLIRTLGVAHYSDGGDTVIRRPSSSAW